MAVTNDDLAAALHRLEIKMTEILTVHGEQLDTMTEQVAQNQRALYGMGEQPGLITKVALLQEGRNKSNIAIAGSYTGVLGWLYDIFFR